MLKPSSILRRLRRRPSGAMIVATGALFLALGGGAYAAVAIPANSISNAMLKNNSVGFAKMRSNAIGYKQIKPGSVGTVRIDQQEVQERVKGTCATGQAISSVAQNGTVTCASGAPAETDSGTGAAVTLTSASTAAQVALFSLNSGSSYLVQASPYVDVTPETTGSTPEATTVTCTLTVGSQSVQRSAVINTTQSGSDGYASIPLMLEFPSSTSSAVAQVGCTRALNGGAPTVKAQARIYAGSNSTTDTTPTTTTTTPIPAT